MTHFGYLYKCVRVCVFIYVVDAVADTLLIKLL